MPDIARPEPEITATWTALTAHVAGETRTRIWIIGDMNAVTTDFSLQQQQKGIKTNARPADRHMENLCTTHTLEATGTGQATCQHREIDHIMVDAASRGQCTTQMVIPATRKTQDHDIIQTDYTSTAVELPPEQEGRPKGIPLQQWEEEDEWK